MDRALHADTDAARDLAGLATALLFEQKYAEAEAAFRESLAIRKRVLGDDHPLVAQTLNDLGVLLYFSGQHSAAEPLFREAATLYERILGHEHPFVSSIENNLGRIALEKGDVSTAETMLSDALAIDRKLKDPGHDDFVYSLNNLGVVRLGLDQPESALALFEEARGIAAPLGHRMLGQIWANLADTYWQLGRLADAQHAIAVARPLLAAAHPDEPWHLANLSSIEGAVRVKQSDVAGAEPLLVDGYKIVSERWGPQGLFTQLAARRLALLDGARAAARLERTPLKPSH
jgi:tetratricopeptide (TPR) repeat protein